MDKKSGNEQKTVQAFSAASAMFKKTNALGKYKWPAIGGGVLLVILALFWITSNTVPPKGNNLYGICRGYIELHLLFPQTLKIIQFEQEIPDGENPNNPMRVNNKITFSSTDGFGQTLLNTVTCGFKFDEKLVGTPWQGIILDRVLFDGRADHGWSDVYYPRSRKNPRAADDRSEELERFYNGIPSLLANPPDLTLPWNDINRMRIEDLQNLR